MELELKIYECLCVTNTFKINGVIADADDLGAGDLDEAIDVAMKERTK